MKKIIFSFLFLFSCLINNAQICNYTPKNNWLYGEEEGEIFNYTLISFNDSFYFIHFYHFLPSVGDEIYEKGNYPKNGKLLSSGKILIKLNNDSIISLNYSNSKNKYYDCDISNAGYRYFIMTIRLKSNELKNIIEIGSNKLRIETDLSFIDLKYNIFNYEYFKEGYLDLQNHFLNLKNKKNMLDNF